MPIREINGVVWAAWRKISALSNPNVSLLSTASVSLQRSEPDEARGQGRRMNK